MESPYHHHSHYGNNKVIRYENETLDTAIDVDAPHVEQHNNAVIVENIEEENQENEDVVEKGQFLFSERIYFNVQYFVCFSY